MGTPLFFYSYFLSPLFLKKLPKWKIFQLEKFPLSPFGVKIGTLTGPDKQIFVIFEKVGKWEIFRFTGKFSSTANTPIHQFFWKKIFRLFQIGQLFTFSIRSETSHIFRPG